MKTCPKCKLECNGESTSCSCGYAFSPIATVPSPQTANVSNSVTFGSAFGVDEFGFVGPGTITVADNQVELSGGKQWSALAQFGVFFGVLVILLIFIHGVFGILIDIFVAMGVMHYFSKSPGLMILERSKVTEINHKGRTVSFKSAEHPSGTIRKCLFQVSDEKTASDLALLLGKPKQSAQT